jgi:hypothetical protein
VREELGRCLGGASRSEARISEITPRYGPTLVFDVRRFAGNRGLRVRKDSFEESPPDAVVPADRSFGGALREHLAPDRCPFLHVLSHSFFPFCRLLDEKLEREPEQNGDVGVRYVSTGFFQPRGETGFDRRLYRARRPKGDTPNL